MGSIERIFVAGAGLMGHGIAQVHAAIGRDVALYEPELARAEGVIRGNPIVIETRMYVGPRIRFARFATILGESVAIGNAAPAGGARVPSGRAARARLIRRAAAPAPHQLDAAASASLAAMVSGPSV